METIYVIGGAKAPYKVGRAKNLERRVSALQTSSPVKLHVYVTAISKQSALDEANVHAALAHRRRSGEWFDCELPEISAAMVKSGLLPVSHAGPPKLLKSYSPICGRGFAAWVSKMKSLAPLDDLDLCEALGMTMLEFNTASENGADLRTALACRALLHRMEPYA